ncbi:hypothetical protein AVEN_44875-1 [Araneus ventricosus]|uniref:Uncharacterized protein n=1 Tax=Araneus ventricosus TaxID=182803 RepID=A0A4Y2PKI0_ARAVE|nr:hypothetical protein AVEN_44875-1 [Araneus ventricosus]
MEFWNRGGKESSVENSSNLEQVIRNGGIESTKNRGKNGIALIVSLMLPLSSVQFSAEAVEKHKNNLGTQESLLIDHRERRSECPVDGHNYAHINQWPREHQHRDPSHSSDRKT